MSTTQFVRKPYGPVMEFVPEKTDEQGRQIQMPYLRFPIFENLRDEEGNRIAHHLMTTRLGGVSSGIYESMNILRYSPESDTWADTPENVDENFRRIALAMGVPDNRFVLSAQTHTTNVEVVNGINGGSGRTRERDFDNVDGLVTNEPGLVLTIFLADCCPVYFVDPVKRAIGLSHSGWRGTVGRISQKTIDKMHTHFGTEAKDLVCAIGPSICQDCYEVSPDVAEAFLKEFPGCDEAGNTNASAGTGEPAGNSEPGAGFDNAPILLKGKRGPVTENQEQRLGQFGYEQDEDGTLYEQKYQLNLWAAIRRTLIEAGVKPENIQVTDICTNCNPDLLFSHRASHGKRGLLGAFLMLEPTE